MLSKRCFCSVLVVSLGTLSQLVMGSGPASIQIDRAEVERVRADIPGRTIIVDWHDTWDYATIQEALNASVDGDTIIVLPSTGSPTGAYVENIIFPARAITLRSINPGDPAIVAATVIDGNASGSVVKFEEGTPAEAALEGFTITNGSGTVLLDLGVIVGGGLYIWGSSPTIANNTIRDNNANYGGGLYVRTSSSTIANNTITDNGASDYGGGLRLYSSSPTIVGNRIAGNSAADGGGLNLQSSSPTIANNTITGNSAEYGGGLSLGFSSPTITNNTITGNSAEYGGGLNLYGGSPTMANTIIAFNSSGIDNTGSGTLTLGHNCVYGNTAYNYSGISDPTGTDGNISTDPLFVRNPGPGPDGLWGTGDDDFGDLQLLSGSPCIDAGNNAEVPADAADLDGDGNRTEPMPFDLAGMLRFVDIPAVVDTGSGTPPIVDMGAYESFTSAPADIDGDGDVDDHDYNLFEFCASGPGVPLAAGCENRDFDGDNDVDMADFAVFQRCYSGANNPADPDCGH